MVRRRLAIALFALSALFATGSLAQDLPPDLTAEGGSLEYLAPENLLIYRDGVSVEYQGVILRVDELRLNTLNLDVEGAGHVRFQRGEDFITGDHISGNLKTKAFTFNQFNGHFQKWLFQANAAQRDEQGVVTARDVALTTCDDWWLEASRMEYQPNGDFKAYHVVYNAFGAPLIYWPYVSGNVHEDFDDWSLSAGHNSDWGLHVRLGRRWRIGNSTRTEVYGDYRTKRGFGIGNETTIVTRDYLADSLAYGMHDQDPVTDFSLRGRDYNNRFEVEEDRYRLRLYQEYQPFSDLTFYSNIDHISDNDLLIEFFRRDYQLNRESPTYVSSVWALPLFDLSLTYRPRVNDFETVIEELPTLRIDMPRTELGRSGIYVQSQNSFAVLRTNWREYDLPRNDGQVFSDYATNRFDTLNFMYTPFLLDWLNVVPRAGVRFTHYEDSSAAAVDDFQLADTFAADDDRSRRADALAITNVDDRGGSLDRTVFELGMRASFKIYGTWNDYQGDVLPLDGLRHIIEPYMNYTYITRPDEAKENLYYFDEIDRIENINFMRVGATQRFQSRRNNKRIYTFVRVENFVDFYANPEGEQPEAGDFGTVVEFRPNDYAGFTVKTLIDLDNFDTSIVDVGTTFSNGTTWSLHVGYLYRDVYRSRYAYSMGSDLTRIGPANTLPITYDQNHNIQVVWTYDFTSKTRFETRHYFDLNAGELATQQYRISHDFRCWITDLTFEKNGEDTRVMLLLTMKGVGRIKAGG